MRKEAKPTADTVRIEIEIEANDETESAMSKITDNLAKVKTASVLTRDSVKKTSDTVTGFDKSAQKTQRTLSNWMKQKYQLLLEAKDMASPILEKLKSGLKGINGKGWSVTMKAVDLVTTPIKGVLNLLRNPIFQAGAVLGVTVGLKDTIDTYKNFEAAMSQVKAVSGASGKDFDNLTEKAKEMGATTKYTATEAAEGFNYMAMAGWKTEDMLAGIEGIMSLAAASGEDLGTTSDIVTDALTAFGLKASDSSRFADVLAQASANANTNVGMLGESFKYVAPVAGAMAYTVEDISLALGLMANASVKGSMAGTSLKTAIANMAAPTKKMSQAMDKYGISLTDEKGKMKSFRELTENLRGSLGGLSEAEQTAAASTIFGKEAMAGMLSVINASEEDYNKLAEAVDNADGASQKMSETMLDNLQGAFTLLQSAADGVKLSLGERLKPYLMDLANWLTDKMPEIEAGLMEFMDFVDEKVDKLKEKIAEFTSTEEWNNADFLGKIKIAWDEIIAIPFGEWWDSKGHTWFVAKALSIGNGIGKALSTGLLALLGVDISQAINDGTSVGSAFAKGLIDGFDVDALQDKIWSAIKGIFSNAGKILPGGEEADLSSWLSAALIAKVVGPLLGAGIKGVKFGKSIFGSQAVPTGSGGTTIIPGIGRKLIGSFSLADEAAGVGKAGGSGFLGLLGKTGIALGSGAASSAGMVLAGSTGVAGGIAGGVTLISGGMDLHKGFTSENGEEAAAYKESGAWKLGGVAAGATIGTMIMPGLGTLVGAGLGGLAGWFMGDKSTKKYENSLKKAEEAAAALTLAEEQAKYESKELKDALADTSVSAEEFALKFEKAVENNLKGHFGNIRLSMAEIETSARKLAMGNNAEWLDKYAVASAGAEKALGNFRASVSDMDKLNWKMTMDLLLEESDLQGYKESVNAYISNAKEYIENKHYEAKASIELIVGVEKSPEFMVGIDAVYSKLQKRIDKKAGKLTALVQIKLDGGEVDEAEIIRLQNDIKAITDKISAAGIEAQTEALKIKYSTPKISIESFMAFQSELQAQIESATQSYDSSLVVGITNLKLQLSEGIIDKNEYDAQRAALIEDYQKKIEELGTGVDFPLGIIVESYAKELEGILPDLEGTTAEKLAEAIHNALAISPKPAEWTSGQIVSWFGLEGLDKESQGAIGQLLQATAATIPESMAESLHRSFTENFPSFEELLQYTEPCGISLVKGITKGVEEHNQLITESAQNAINKAFASPFDAAAEINVKPNLTFIQRDMLDMGFPFSGGFPVKFNANGSIVDSPVLSVVGEDGPEAIIPLGPKRRSRGLSLWQQAGELLGVRQFATGGMVSGLVNGHIPYANSEGLNDIYGAYKMQPWDDRDIARAESGQIQNSVAMPVSVTPPISEKKIEIKIEVQSSPNIEIGGGSDAEQLKKVIRNQMKEIADDLGGEIAAKLEVVFSNMPI